MTSPAVSSPPHRALDPTKKAHFTLRLSDRITKGANVRGGFANVKLNHKPPQKGQERTSTISSSSDGATLTLEDDDAGRVGKYKYKGQRANTKKSYVLVFDQEKQTCTLEPVSTSYKFNLTSTPHEPSAAKLAAQYPQISLRSQDGDDDDLFGDAGNDGDSPYDYRNFLAPDRDSVSPPMVASSTNTPDLSAIRKPKTAAPARKSAVSSSQPSQPSQKPKPKAKAKAPAPRRQPQRSPSPITEEPRTTVPEIHLSRRASTRPEKDNVKKPTSPTSPTSPDLDNFLEIDYRDSPPERNKSHILGGLGLPDHASKPISLRSAANSASPGSRLHTPQQEEQTEFEFDFAPTKKPDEDDEMEDEDADGEAESDVDGEADYDVDPLSIGSPVQEQTQAPVQEEDDEDADFEEALMEGMLDDSEESEEE